MHSLPPTIKRRKKESSNLVFLLLVVIQSPLQFSFQQTPPNPQQPSNMETPNHTFLKLSHFANSAVGNFTQGMNDIPGWILLCHVTTYSHFPMSCLYYIFSKALSELNESYISYHLQRYAKREERRISQMRFPQKHRSVRNHCQPHDEIYLQVWSIKYTLAQYSHHNDNHKYIRIHVSLHWTCVCFPFSHKEQTFKEQFV